jgi:hypothetical protein|tara:strand:+ start:204 stop:383 length:180 start_codon:yes stop_codon:yes gene_type:complete
VANTVAKTHILNSNSGQTIGIVPITGAHSDLEIRGTKGAGSHSVGKIGHKDYITQKFVN